VNDKVYKVPFAFNGTIDSLKLVVDRPKLSDADKERLKAAMTAKN
jgi:arylsulfatase